MQEQQFAAKNLFQMVGRIIADSQYEI